MEQFRAKNEDGGLGAQFVAFFCFLVYISATAGGILNPLH